MNLADFTLLFPFSACSRCHS